MFFRPRRETELEAIRAIDGLHERKRERKKERRKDMLSRPRPQFQLCDSLTWAADRQPPVAAAPVEVAP